MPTLIMRAFACLFLCPCLSLALALALLCGSVFRPLLLSRVFLVFGNFALVFDFDAVATIPRRFWFLVAPAWLLLPCLSSASALSLSHCASFFSLSLSLCRFLPLACQRCQLTLLVFFSSLWAAQ